MTLKNVIMKIYRVCIIRNKDSKHCHIITEKNEIRSLLIPLSHPTLYARIKVTVLAKPMFTPFRQKLCSAKVVNLISK
jgi:hypothetical protein